MHGAAENVQTVLLVRLQLQTVVAYQIIAMWRHAVCPVAACSPDAQGSLHS